MGVTNMRHLWVLDGPSEKRFPKEGYFSDDEISRAIRAVKAAIA